jgi:hypothetical protein
MKALISRRKLILTGAAAGGVVAVGGVTVHLGPPAPGMRLLSVSEVELVEAVASVLFPAGVFSVAGGDGQTAPEVDRLLTEVLPAEVVGPFRYVLRALQWGTVISRGTRFTQLDAPTAAEVVGVWASENPFPRRVAFTSVQAILGLAYFRRPEVVDAVGWRAGCLG